MKLYLVQHGEACAKEVDPERPLTEKGKSEVQSVAQFLKQAGIQLGRVIHSGKLRAMQTAEIMITNLAPDITLETSNKINPNDDPEACDWHRDKGKGDVLVVGHLPFMARLVSHLLVANVDQVIVAYQPGSIVCLEFVDNTRWQLNWMIRPELIPIAN